MKKIFILCAVWLVTAAVYAGQYPEIKMAELKSAMASSRVTLLDANGTDSWKEGHIPGAIDFVGNKEKLSSLLPKNKDALVVAYCAGPRCQAYKSAAAAAEKLGYKNVKHFAAGISGWQQAGGRTERGS
ncbi:MAG TPA: rhodanese-like domain-containing protein [Verrucomicrobiae bacterium]|nr:rhodanese-like domain-containing protein [Verrucomicrobiae bacterium]